MPVRRKISRIRRIADSQELDTFILLVILFNCVTMAFPPARLHKAESNPKSFFFIADYVLIGIFDMEFSVKFWSYGLSYFKDPWNWLDFVVVVQGTLQVLTLIPGQGDALQFADLSALRMMRVLRPLKSLRKFPEMRLLVGSLFGSFNLLLAIIMLTAMVIFCFGIFGSLYIGDALNYRCVPDPFWDPFYGTMSQHPAFNASHDTKYWTGPEPQKAWARTVEESHGLRSQQEEFLAKNWFFSLSQYASYSRDEVPQVRTYPYLANFCGECSTCRKCEPCYSDNPADGCSKTMESFRRRYGRVENIKKGFHLEANGSDTPSLGFLSDFYINTTEVTYITEKCIDLTKAHFKIGVDVPGLYKVDGFTPLGLKSYGGFIARMRGKALDITNPDLDLEQVKYAYQEANCYNRGRKRTNFLNRTDGRLGDCKKKKTGSLRAGVMGDPVPREEKLRWYLGFERTSRAILTIFDMINFEAWNDVMWSVQMAAGKYTWTYFYGVIMFVNICLLNLFPAVMSFNLRKAIRDEELKEAFEAKAQFMGDELVSMTAFEEHMVDMLAAEEEELAAVKNYISQAVTSGGTGTQVGIRPVEVDVLEGVVGVPRYPGAETLRNIVRPEMGYFNLFIYLCILVNIGVLATEPMSIQTAEGKRTLEAVFYLNIIFTLIFALEIVIKLAAMGAIGYFMDGYNVFDFCIGMLGLFDVVLQGTFEGKGIFGVLRVVRMARVARVLRIASISKIHRGGFRSDVGQLDFGRLMSIISSASVWVVNVLGLLFLTMYMASIISMQFFGGEVYVLNDYSGQWTTKGRLNFDSFTMSLMTNFIILTGDSWQEIMYETMDATGAVACFYFILLLIIAKYAIFSMLIAVIFDQVERDSIAVIKKSAQRTMISVFRFDHSITRYFLRYHYMKWYLATRSQFERSSAADDDGKKMGQVSLPQPPKPPLTRVQKFWLNKRSYMIFPPETQPRRFLIWFAHSSFFSYMMLCTIMTSVIILGLYYEAINKTGKELAQIRRENPAMATVQAACLIIFVTEFAISTIAHGLLNFLSEAFNCLDTLVTAISLIALSQQELAPFAVARMIRIIRPLKMLARSSPAVTSILIALENSALGLRAVGLLATLCWCTIAIIGLQLFQGRLFYCSAAKYPQGKLLKSYRGHELLFKGTHRSNDWPGFAFEGKDNAPFPATRDPENSEGCSFEYPEAFPMHTRNNIVVSAVGMMHIRKADYNFDNFWESFKSAFVVFTFDDWHKLVLQVINAKTKAAYINHEAETSTILPIIFFIVAACSSFVITSLFVGVIYGTFTYQMLTSSSRRLASLKQAQWTVYEAKLNSIKPIQEPREPRSNVLLVRMLFRIFRHRQYKNVYALLLFVDIFLWWIYVGSQVHLAPIHRYEEDLGHLDSNFVRMCRSADTAFATFLLAEFVIKLAVFGLVTMLSLPSEQFRAVLMLPIAIYVALEYSNSWESLRALDSEASEHGDRVQKFIYGLRTTQVFLVIPMFVELRMVVLALKAALTTTMPMMILMIMCTFAYAVIGMVVFGWKEIDKNDANGARIVVLSYWSIARFRFDTIAGSMNTLFTSATANNWISVRDSMAHNLPSRFHIPLDLFWFTYILLVRFLFLNVCTLIFIYEYESSSPLQPWIAMQQVKEFLVAWQHFDEFGVGRIRTKYLSRLLRLLAPPLGLSRDAPQQLADRHARRVLMAMPPIMEKELAMPGGASVDHAARWAEVKKPFYTRGGGGGGLPITEEHAPSLLPRYLEFSHVLKAVHRVVMFPELQHLPDDLALAHRREVALAKLDVLRLAINRFCEPHAKTVDTAGNRVPPAVYDMSLMQRVRPDVFRFRLRQALTLETHRWAKQIELSKFDEESFFECDLLRRAIKEERLAAQMQLEVMNRLAARGVLMSMQERRPRLHRHIMFLSALLNRIESVRVKHIRRAWLENTMEHVGTLPIAPRSQSGGPARHRAVSSIATSRMGDLLVCAHGGATISVWKRRKQKHHDGDNPGFPTPSSAVANNNNSSNSNNNKKKDAAGKKGKKDPAAADPWMTSPFYKTQTFTEDLGTALVVTMTPDGKRFFSTAGPVIRGWVQAKKQHGYAPGTKKVGTRFFCESMMRGHTEAINALRIDHRHLFSCGDDGHIKLWRLRASSAQQTAPISFSSKALSLCCVNAARDGANERDSSMGYHALVGLESGEVAVLPYSLKQQWLQGASWSPKFTIRVFDGVPVTALAFEFRNVYAGGATGSIRVYKMVAGTEDLATLDHVADQLANLGFGSDAAVFMRAQQSEEGAKLLELLQQIVRLEPVYALNAHTGPVTGFALGGGVLFSVALDMAVVAWKRASVAQTQPQPPAPQHALAMKNDPHHKHQTSQFTRASSLLGGHGSDFSQKYSTAQVVHKAAISGIAVAGDDLLITADADGFVLAHKASKYREVIQSKQSTSALQAKTALEEEVLEKPRFFHQHELAKMAPRLFLAYLLAHYYPIKPLKKPRKKLAGAGAGGNEENPAQDLKDDGPFAKGDHDDSDDDQYLDDDFDAAYDDDMWEDEDGDAEDFAPEHVEDYDANEDDDEAEDNEDDDEEEDPQEEATTGGGPLSYFFATATPAPEKHEETEDEDDEDAADDKG